jgi:hypothetical protein
MAGSAGGGAMQLDMSSSPSWPASYRGWLLRIERLPDERYVGYVAGAYQSLPQLTGPAALADVKAWCDVQPVRVGVSA